MNELEERNARAIDYLRRKARVEDKKKQEDKKRQEEEEVLYVSLLSITIVLSIVVLYLTLK